MSSTGMSEDLRAALLGVPVSAITTVLTRLGFPNSAMRGVRPIDPATPKLVAVAYTLRYIPSRPDLDGPDGPSSFGRPESIQRKAIEECPPGSALVIDARGTVSAACAGDMLSLRLAVRGAAGIVTDGGLRDAGEIAKLGFPAYFQAPAPTPTPVVHHPVEVDVPIACGGVAVYPGDIVVGDGDGVVVIPVQHAETVAEEGAAILAYDAFVEHEVRAGRSLFGLYPATDISRREYAAWRRVHPDA